MELSFLAGLCPIATELPSFSHHLVWIFFVLFFNEERKTDGISASSCALCAVIILQHPCLIPVSCEQEEKIKNAYCSPSIHDVADAVLDFASRPLSCLASGCGRWAERVRSSEGRIHVLGISQRLLVCLFNEG